MKRFFCTICKKVKRVRRWPILLENQESMDARLRVGECNHHNARSQYVAPQILSRKVAR